MRRCVRLTRLSCAAVMALSVVASPAGAGAGAEAGAGSGAGARGGAAATAAAGRHPASHMLVYAQEWSLWRSRKSVPAGRVTVELWNRGQDAHDLRIRRLNRHGHLVGHGQAVALTGSGAVRHATWHLRAGKYLIYCSLPQHRKRGMHTRLVVR